MAPTVATVLTREDVIAAYETILGRPPESEEVIAYHQRHASAADLIKTFWHSDEAKSRRTPHAPRSYEALPNFAQAEIAKGSAIDIANRERYLDLMAKILTNMIYQDPSNNPENTGPFVADNRIEGRDWPVQAHTMAGLKRLTSLRRLVQRTLDEGVAGHFAETGIWRGGCCIMMRAVLAANGVKNRNVYAFDSFEGLPKPNEALYPADKGLMLNEYTEFEVGLEQVKDNFSRYGLLDDQVKFVKGYFENTLPTFTDGPFALLRLDGDLYESTILALEHLYPKLSPGGFVVIDDYGCIPQCAKAVDDFRSKHAIDDPLTWVDWTGLWWRKS
jgi:O-methyltransferase/8-demethyl-8-(2,3-dimethoxy-alpha-L-rhamnosyl)tetracenomycin-C 4'-O-methyltransferase